MRKTLAILMAASVRHLSMSPALGAHRDRRGVEPVRGTVAAARPSPRTRRWARSRPPASWSAARSSTSSRSASRTRRRNEVEGFDADLCREIAAAIGVEPEFVEAVSANRLPFLKEDKVDIVISTMTRNEERLKEIDFSKIYYVAGQKILVKSDSTHQIGRRPRGGQRQGLLRRGLHVGEEPPGRRASPRPNWSCSRPIREAAQALLDGRCDAVSTDDSILFGLASQNEGLEVRGEAFTEEPLGIGIKKGKDDLVQFINGVLDAMAADGRWKALYDKNIKPYSGAEAPTPPLDQYPRSFIRRPRRAARTSGPPALYLGPTMLELSPALVRVQRLLPRGLPEHADPGDRRADRRPRHRHRRRRAFGSGAARSCRRSGPPTSSSSGTRRCSCS